jgi:hypothetical protein
VREFLEGRNLAEEYGLTNLDPRSMKLRSFTNAADQTKNLFHSESSVPGRREEERLAFPSNGNKYLLLSSMKPL